MAETMYNCDHIQVLAEPKNTGELFTQKRRKGHRRRFKNNCFFFGKRESYGELPGKAVGGDFKRCTTKRRRLGNNPRMLWLCWMDQPTSSSKKQSSPSRRPFRSNSCACQSANRFSLSKHTGRSFLTRLRSRGRVFPLPEADTHVLSSMNKRLRSMGSELQMATKTMKSAARRRYTDLTK